MSPSIYRTNTFEGVAKTLLARVVGYDGTPIDQSTITSVSLKQYDYDDPEVELNVSAPAVASVIFNFLQNDPLWVNEVGGAGGIEGEKVDEIGYNFRHTVPGSWFPNPNVKYILEYLFTPTSGEPFAIKYIVDTVAMGSL